MTNVLRLTIGALQPPFFGQARKRSGRETLQLLQIREVLIPNGDLALQPLNFGLEFLDQLLLGADFLARVILDGPGPEAGAEHAQAFGPLRVERAVERPVRASG